MTAPTLTQDQTSDHLVVRVSGALVTESLAALETAFASVLPTTPTVRIDMSALEAIDTGGAWMVSDLQARLEKAGSQVEIAGAQDAHATLLNTVRRARADTGAFDESPRGFQAWLARIGAGVVQAGRDCASFLSFLGLTLHRLGGTLVRPWRLRTASLFSQMQDAGLNAVPIVSLMGFLIGVVLAFQGAAQLRQFGAEVFVVDLISISILRELGILLTAIIVSGRSGSAFTASIGSMKVQEEIDAMRTLGLDPIEVLVLPRVIALMIMLPVLGFVANISGMIGGGLMSWIELGVSPGMFVTRLHETTDVWHLIVGMIKAPFFAIIIGTVSCWQAMQVRGSAESVGRRTTSSVVQSIFLVIAADALFSVFFQELGV
ncbi:MAG: MlaE family lipid ABC transporter permease subunit [Pseudomonadota bacterium]